MRLIRTANGKVIRLKMSRMTIKRMMKFDCGRTVLRIVITNRNSMYLLIIWRLGKSDFYDVTYASNYKFCLFTEIT